MDKRSLRRGAAFLAAVTLIGIAGWLARGTPREGPGNLIAYGPFLIPRAGLRLSPLEARSVDPSLVEWFQALRLVLFALPSEGSAFAFSKSDITGAEIITMVAGTGTSGVSGDGGPATSAQLYNPTGVAVDGTGNLFIADLNNSRMRKGQAAHLRPIADGRPDDELGRRQA